MIKQIKPTEGELEILQVLWEKENATVREVHEALSETKECGYTTTLKLMQIMFEKGLVLRDDSSRTHIYRANVSREKTQKAQKTSASFAHFVAKKLRGVRRCVEGMALLARRPSRLFPASRVHRSDATSNVA